MMGAAQSDGIERSRHDSAVATYMLRFSYGLMGPVGDLADRFGLAHQVGGSFAYKAKSGWVISVGGGYIFGEQVRNPHLLLKDLLTPDNIVIGQDGRPAIINIGQAGYQIDLRVGRLLPWLRANRNSGILIDLGTAFMEHWVSYDVENNAVAQLTGEYVKGYDRLTNGFMLTQFIGYHFQGRSRLVNIYGGFECSQGFMGNRRSYDIPQRQKIDPSLTYYQFGFRLGWMLPFYKRNQETYYYH